jgi:hypothetical protein
MVNRLLRRGFAGVDQTPSATKRGRSATAPRIVTDDRTDDQGMLLPGPVEVVVVVIVVLAVLPCFTWPNGPVALVVVVVVVSPWLVVLFLSLAVLPLDPWVEVDELELTVLKPAKAGDIAKASAVEIKMSFFIVSFLIKKPHLHKS